MYKTIAESNNFIVLDKYTKHSLVNEAPGSYQSEADLEREFIKKLINQGNEMPQNINTHEAMLENVREQIEILNTVEFSDGEWARFVEEYLDNPSDHLVEKSRKIHDDYIYDFVFDDGRIQNIYLVDKNNITKNKVQVISQRSEERRVGKECRSRWYAEYLKQRYR